MEFRGYLSHTGEIVHSLPSEPSGQHGVGLYMRGVGELGIVAHHVLKIRQLRKEWNGWCMIGGIGLRYEKPKCCIFKEERSELGLLMAPITSD